METLNSPSNESELVKNLKEQLKEKDQEIARLKELLLK